MLTNPFEYGGTELAMKSAGASIGVLLVSVAALLAGSVPAGAVEEASVGQLYDDRLDSRLSAAALTNATRAIGYSSTAFTNGRHADDLFLDGLDAAVMGLFGHGNGGILQVSEGATDASDSFFGAGTATDIVGPVPNVKFVTEYLPYVEVDDMRLLIVGGCYTATSGPFGDFSSAGASRGIDAVVTFEDLVYFPANPNNSPVSETNYSGNFFWDRFSAHVKANTVATALARARTDLVAKEGRAGGWDSYVYGGASPAPGTIRLAPAGPGQPLQSEPLTTDGGQAIATSSYASFDALSPTDTKFEVGPSGESLKSVSTAEGVSYRTRTDGSVLDAVAVPSTSGPTTLTPMALS